MRDERGFTLIEMIITVMLMGIVVATIGESLILMFNTTEATTQRLSESPDLQIASAYFGGDVQSAKTVETSSFGTTCPDPLPAGASPVLNLSWIDPGGDPDLDGDTTRRVTYVVESVSNQKQLVRYYCNGATEDSATLVNFIDPDPTKSPEAACLPNCGAATSVRLPLSICTADTTNVCKDPPALDFELKATRRMS